MKSLEFKINGFPSSIVMISGFCGKHFIVVGFVRWRSLELF